MIGTRGLGDMFGTDDDAACSGCSFTADSLDGSVVHLENRGASFVAVSRAPLEKLLAEEERRSGTGFNFGTSRRADINARDMELHGLSAFALEDGAVYRTPNGRGDDLDGWSRRHDEYKEAVNAG